MTLRRIRMPAMSDQYAHECGIYYPITPTPKYVWLALRSARTIREHNSTIPITLFVFGSTEGLDLSEADGLRVDVTTCPESLVGIETWGKWLALRYVPYRRAMCLDPDTTCFEDPMILFSRYEGVDFAAREEVGTQRSATPYLVGNRILYPQIDWPLFLEIRSRFGSRDLPLFNTGIMLFNEGVAARVVERLAVAERLRGLWAAGELAYPCSNRYIVEELCASVMVGCTEGLSVATIEPGDAPMYLEWLGRTVSGPGVIMHVWNAYLPFHIAEFDGEALAGEYAAFSAVLPESDRQRSPPTQ